MLEALGSQAGGPRYRPRPRQALLDRAATAGSRCRPRDRRIADRSDRQDAEAMQEQMLRGKLAEMDAEKSEPAIDAHGLADRRSPAIEKMLLGSFTRNPRVHVAHRRAQPQLDAAARRVPERPSPCFVVVGAAHLVGPKVCWRSEAKGYGLNNSRPGLLPDLGTHGISDSLITPAVRSFGGPASPGRVRRCSVSRSCRLGQKAGDPRADHQRGIEFAISRRNDDRRRRIQRA